jgi:beta-glucosidase
MLQKEGSKLYINFTVKNTGDRDGADAAQLYIHDVVSSVPRPPKELKGFKKVFLKKGESKMVKMELDRSAFTFWHPETKQWTLEPGEFELFIGTSSRNICLSQSLRW